MQINEGIVQLPPTTRMIGGEVGTNQTVVFKIIYTASAISRTERSPEHHIELSSDVTGRIDRINLAFFLGWSMQGQSPKHRQASLDLSPHEYRRQSSDLWSANATESFRYPAISVNYLFSVGHAGQHTLGVIVKAALRTVVQGLADSDRKKHDVMLSTAAASRIAKTAIY